MSDSACPGLYNQPLQRISMPAESGTYRIREVPDVVRALQRAKGKDGDQSWGGVVFLIGAGCSRSAGIPVGEEIARDRALDLAHRYSNGTFAPESSDDALKWLRTGQHVPADTDWANAYGRIFEYQCSDPTHQREIVLEATNRGQGINWAHVCLGELIRRRYVHTVLTTNFDHLV